ncbi:MAG: alkaline phosphatase [Planctomycetaceae bacterium]|nr:alkaline phosphatase [Planctomycetaceae bacterium]
MLRRFCCGLFAVAAFSTPLAGQDAPDHLGELQTRAIKEKQASWGHWGLDPQNYTQWGTHSNRLIPIYTFGTRQAGTGLDLDDYTRENSIYRDADRLEELYGRPPESTYNPEANYGDQTDLARIQFAALAQGKKHIVLIVFDGMDWQTTQAAAIVRNQNVDYDSGRGHGLYFQDYQADGTSQFGAMVTAPAIASMKVDTDKQTVEPGSKLLWGGYNARLGGSTPWDVPLDREYLIGKSSALTHPYPDSAATATSMTSGIKTFNGSINVGVDGSQAESIAHRAQKQGYRVGVVSSVPISHATPAAAYAHNVSRNDYHEITRDLIGRPSVSHPQEPLPGLDVVLGGGVGELAEEAETPIEAFETSKYVDAEDLRAVSQQNGGKYVVAVRTAGQEGKTVLESAATQAIKNDQRLLGVFGVGQFSGHLPFQTANGDYQPAPGRAGTAEEYSEADLDENPTLADMTSSALQVLSRGDANFWLLVEAGDVDWANHDDNLDNSIGAVFSGEQAFKVVTDWVEEHSNWQESLVIVTADHGHYFFMTKPDALITPAPNE